MIIIGLDINRWIRNLETFLSTLQSLSYYHTKRTKIAEDNKDNDDNEISKNWFREKEFNVEL